jgi:hypothetical protein
MSKEKNWMPFVYRHELHVVYSMQPQRVFMLYSAGGVCAAYTTDSGELLRANGLPSERVHGGPPVVRIGYSGLRPALAGRSGARRHSADRSMYLGMLHYYIEDPSTHFLDYHHYLFVMQSRPPFRLCAVSAELPLEPALDQPEYRRKVQYVSGLFFDAASRQLLISYGAADSVSRVLTMPIDQALALFQGLPCVCQCSLFQSV